MTGVDTGTALLIWAWTRCGWRVAALRRLGLPEDHSVRTAWDFSFDRGSDVLVIVTLRDGSRLAGHYGRRSHSAYGTRTRDLFLERRWVLDEQHGLLRPTPDNLGIWVNAEDIVAVERYDPAHAHQALADAPTAR